MKNPFNPKPVRIELTVAELRELWPYIDLCRIKAFTGINNFMKEQPMREYFFAWHLTEIYGKVFELQVRHSRDHETNKVRLKLTDPERRTLSAMFRRVECTPYMLQLQERFINQLTPLPHARR